MKGPGWDAHHNGARGHGSQDNRSGSYHCRITDRRAWQDDCSDPDVGERADAHPAAQDNARRDVDVIGDPAIVLDNSSRVDDAVFSDDGAGIDDNSRHHDGSPAKAN
jgi:hypothetical protein